MARLSKKKRQQLKEKLINKNNSIDYNNKIFDYLKAYDNNILNDMSGDELIDLIYYLEQYLLTYRDRINIKNDTTFGIEIEAEYADIDVVKGLFENRNLTNGNRISSKDWIVKTDASIKTGVECASPIFHDNNFAWSDIKLACKLLRGEGTIGERSGGHIHVGAKVLKDDEESWNMFLKTWMVYEKVLFRFLFGSFVNERGGTIKYCAPMSRSISSVIDDEIPLQRLFSRITPDKYWAVNLGYVSLNERFWNNYKNTIEFRCPNGSLDEVVWQNNINLVTKLLERCKNKKIDLDIVEKRRKLRDEKLTNLNLYDSIYLDDCLELADLLFDNNVDKIYFLKQYLKDLKVVVNEKLTEAKPFTKTLMNR